ncbi:MAG: LytTR family DNA-binding domain-containing protein [Cloacibacillus sp.]
MYQIALCDDELSECAKIQELLEAYKTARSDCEFTVHQFTSIDALTNHIRQTETCDLLLLDIYMSEQNGINCVKELRKDGLSCPVIFITVSKEHAVEAFEVDAAQYLLKPVERERFFSAMDKALKETERKRRKYLALQVDGALRRIALNDIAYCESHGNYQHIVMTNGTEQRVRTTLTALAELIGCGSDFMRVGISYLINMNHVDSLSSKLIMFDNGRKINVPRGTYQTLKEQYFRFYCER